MGLRFRLLVATVLIIPIYIGLNLLQQAYMMIPEDNIVGARSHSFIRASTVSEFWEDASNYHKSQTCFFVGSHGDLRLLNKEVVESFDIIFTDRTDFSQYGWTPDYLYTEDRMFLERHLLTPALFDTVTFVRKDWVVPTATAESHATNTTEKKAGITAQWLWSPPSDQVLNAIGKNVLEGGEAVLLSNGVVPFTAMDSCEVSKKNVVESCSYTSVEDGDGDGELGVVGQGSDINFCREACSMCFCKTARTVSGHHTVAVGRTSDAVGHTAAALQFLFALNCGSVQMWGSAPRNSEEVRFSKPARNDQAVARNTRAVFERSCRNLRDDGTTQGKFGTVLRSGSIFAASQARLARQQLQPTLTIWAIPKDFSGINGVNQELALRSWLALSPRPRVLLFGDAEGLDDIERRYSPYVSVVQNIPLNEWGVPLLATPLRLAAETGSRALLYVNADIVLSPNTTRVLSDVSRRQERFLITGRRFELEASDIRHAVALLWEAAQKRGKWGGPTFCDYFLFSNDGLFDRMPDFAVGRAYFDWYFVLEALESMDRGDPTLLLDGTYALGAYHLKHDYSHVAGVYDQAVPSGQVKHRNDSPDTLINAQLFANAFGMGSQLNKLAFGRKSHEFCPSQASLLFRKRVPALPEFEYYMKYSGTTNSNQEEEARCQGIVRRKDVVMEKTTTYTAKLSPVDVCTPVSVEKRRPEGRKRSKRRGGGP